MLMDASGDTRAALMIASVVAEAVKELGTVPSGHLYSRICGFLTFNQYTSCLEVLKRANLIVVKNHEITWVGGK